MNADRADRLIGVHLRSSAAYSPFQKPAMLVPPSKARFDCLLSTGYNHV
jgi:hypothetical protein